MGACLKLQKINKKDISSDGFLIENIIGDDLAELNLSYSHTCRVIKNLEIIIALDSDTYDDNSCYYIMPNKEIDRLIIEYELEINYNKDTEVILLEDTIL